MKIKPYVLPGIFFLAAFLVMMLIGMATGFWNPAGIGVSETEHKGEEEKGQTVELPELHGYVNFIVYLRDNKIPVDCVAQKLGLKESALDKPARDVASDLGIETFQLPLIYKDCIGAKGGKKGEEKPKANLPELKGYMNLLEYLDVNNILPDCVAEKLGIPLPDLNNEAKAVAEKIGKAPEDLLPFIAECIGAKPKDQELPDLKNPSETSIVEPPFLAGYDNLLSYLEINKVQIECVAKKLKVDRDALNKTAKEVAENLKLGHVEAIRAIIKECTEGR